jgi:hypothetical protein
MKPPTDLPRCDWDAIRDAYVEHFGPLYLGRLIDEEEGPPFAILCFWDPGRPSAPAVYASFGAPAGELFLMAVAPGLGIGDLLERAARSSPRELDAPAVLQAKARWTPFGGVIVLPEGEDGFGVTGRDGRVRWVRRAVAVTRRERTRALLESVEAVLPKVRAARGEVADVLRDCTVRATDTASFRAHCAPAAVRRLRRLRASTPSCLPLGRPPSARHLWARAAGRARS